MRSYARSSPARTAESRAGTEPSTNYGEIHMKMQLLGSSSILAVVITLTVMGPSLLDAQAPPRAANAGAADRSALPRTPWGSADLQGTWTSEGELGVPFERAEEFGERQHLTDAEYTARARQTQLRDEEALAEIDVFT